MSKVAKEDPSTCNKGGPEEGKGKEGDKEKDGILKKKRWEKQIKHKQPN